MRRVKFSCWAALLGGVLVTDAFSQVPVSVGVYQQSFGSLAVSGTSNPWTDNATLPGWFAAKTSNGVAVTTYRASPGTDNTGALYSYGTNSAERALGSLCSAGVGDIAFAVMFTNNTGEAQTDITVSYTGEQWRNGGNANQHQFYVDYQVSPAAPVMDALFGGAWLAFPFLEFTGPTAGTNVAALNGNNPTNRQVFSDVSLSGVILQAGEVLTLRWLDINDAGSDHGLAIDDLIVTFPGVIPVTNPPAITAQPQSRTTNAGTSVRFSVTVTGTEPLGFQWRRNGNALTDTGKFVGSRNAALTVGPVVKADEATFDVVITNSVGSVTSLVATLTVIDPAINNHPFSRTNVPGDITTFNVSAAGTTSLNYQWRKDGVDIDDADNTSYQITNITEAHEGTYTVRVSNGLGSITSSNAFLNVIDTPSTRFAHFNFNNTNTPATTNAPTTTFGNGSATVIGNTIGAFASGTSSDPGGLSGGTNFGWNSSDYPPVGTLNKTAGVEFRVSTVGYQQIFITWQQRHSATASRHMRFQYSVNGTYFVDQNVYSITEDSVFLQLTSDLTTIPGVANNPNFAFRIVAEWESTATGSGPDEYRATGDSSYSGNGTVRFEMVSVFGNGTGAPDITNIEISGNDVRIDFTADEDQPPGAYKVERSAVLGGSFGEVPATVSALGGGQFRATVATSGPQQFYRIRQD